MSKPQSLTQQASHGAFWSLASNITVSAVSFVGTVILARILTPKDFGLIGMAVLVTGVVNLFGNFGLGAALVHKQDATDEDLSTVFWANMAAGVVLALGCILVSPLAAIFFHENDVMWVLVSLAVTFVLSALCSVHNTLIYKNIRMRPLAVVEVSGRVIRVMAMLVAAFCGLKFWSIVIGMLIERAYKTAAFFILEKWRPSRVFSMERFKEMFRYGRNFFAGGFLGYLNQNMDVLVTARVLGADLLGFYQMAYNLPSLLRGYLNDSIGTVAFPVFCKVQDDNERLVRGLSKIIKFIAIGTFPILAGLFFTAHDFIFVVYGEKWLPVVKPMQILCLCAAITSVNTVIGPLLNAKGRPDLGLKWGMARLPAMVIAIFAGVHFGGLIGVAWGVVIVEVLSLAIVYQAFQILDDDLRAYAKALFPATVATLIMVLALAAVNQVPVLQNSSSLIRLITDFVIGAAVYIAVVVFGFKETFQDFLKAISLLMRGSA